MQQPIISDLLDHIQASAPCSLFGVAVWANEQFNVSTLGFITAMDALVSSGVISVSADESGLVIDLA